MGGHTCTPARPVQRATSSGRRSCRRARGSLCTTASCQETRASWTGPPNRPLCLAARGCESVCLCLRLWALGGALLLGSCSHRYPSPGTVQRYLPSWVVGTVPPPPNLQSRSTLEVRAILVPGSPPLSGTPARLLAWVQHCVRLAATITPLCWVLAARKMLMGTSCPIPLLVDVPPPTPTPCSLLACKYLPLSSSPPLPPLAIRHSFILPLSRTSPSKPPSPFLDSVQKRREGEYYPLGCIDIRTQLPL